jgi:hypothetical protein
MLLDISKKSISVESIANKIIKENKLIDDLIDNSASDKAAVKYKCLKVLTLLSEQKPSILYPEWNFFVKLLDNKNSFLRTIGVTIIANLTNIDTENKFENIFEKYYSLLEDKSMINAANVAVRSGIIAKAKPHLQDKITNKLLDIDKTHHSSECKNIIKGKAILSFDEYIDEFDDKEKIIQFVKKELKIPDQLLEKRQKNFLKSWKNE